MFVLDTLLQSMGIFFLHLSCVPGEINCNVRHCALKSQERILRAQTEVTFLSDLTPESTLKLL